MNLIFPLLHRPTFEQSLAENLHLRDARFGAVVLLVAAVGARFSSDSRVYVPGTKQLSSVGGVWFRQVRIELQSLYAIPNLYDLQTYCVRRQPLRPYTNPLTVRPIVVRDVLAEFRRPAIWLGCHWSWYQAFASSRRS